MNLRNTLEIYSGGEGSGCNPAVAIPRCGRPSGNQNEETPVALGWWKPTNHSFAATIDGKKVEIIRQVIKLSNGLTSSASPWQVLVDGVEVAIEKTTATKVKVMADNGVYTRGVRKGLVELPPKKTYTKRDTPQQPVTKSFKDFFRIDKDSNGRVAFHVAKAAQLLEEGGFSQKMYAAFPKVGISLATLPRNILGRFNSWAGKIQLGKDHRSTHQTVLHEFGHFLDHVFNDTPIGGYPKIDGNASHSDRKEMIQEYYRAAQKVKADNGLLYMKMNWNAMVWKIDNTKYSVSNYALTNAKEWFAESFKFYFTSKNEEWKKGHSREWMKQNTPATFRHIDRLVKGAYVR